MTRHFRPRSMPHRAALAGGVFALLAGCAGGSDPTAGPDTAAPTTDAATPTTQPVSEPEPIDTADRSEPEPSPTHPILAPAATSHLGATWFSPPDPASADTVLERWADVQEASTVGRVMIDWIEVEPEQGDYELTELDDALGDLVDAGLAPMASIVAVDVSGTEFPEWLGGFDPEAAADSYVEMIEAALPTLRAHDVWLLAIANEPPLADGELDLDDFATFVSAVERGADAIAPELAVTFTFAGGDAFIDAPAIDRMIEAVDVFSVNHYCIGANLVRLPLDEATARIDRLVERAGDLPVVFQEFGCPAGEANGSSDVDQLAWFETAYDHIESIEQVRAAFAFEFLDWSPETFELDYGSTLEVLTAEVGEEFVERFESWPLTSGMVRSDGSTRPSFDWFLDAAAS